MTVLLDPLLPWRTHKADALTVHWLGDAAFLDDVLASCMTLGVDGVTKIGAKLALQTDPFALIVEGPDFLFAAVDRIRSHPLVYYCEGDQISVLGDSARRVREKAGLTEIDQAAVFEFAAAGYVSGAETVYAQLKQMLCGECLLSRSDGGGFERHRYYYYLPIPETGRDEASWIDELAGVVDQMFQRVIERANGDPIWLPLSGGLDSRLIACKLTELGYDRIETFSYGPPGNDEARIAKRVAEKLNLPWRFLPSLADGAAEAFQLPERMRYWAYADSLSALPSMQEWQAFNELSRTSVLPENAVIINGQSGDYLTGGHIPASLMHGEKPTEQDLLDALTAKHYAQWRHLLSADNIADIHDKIRSVLPAWPEQADREELIALHEAWEYQERQCKYVVNGQRLYEFIERPNWQLPLWDGLFIDFWQKVPFDLKFEQTLFRSYLRSYNYRGLFEGFEPQVWRWPRHMKWVVPLARSAGVVLGDGAKAAVYRFFRYHGHYNNHYAAFGYRKFLSTLASARGTNSLYIEAWLKENNLIDDIRDLA